MKTILAATISCVILVGCGMAEKREAEERSLNDAIASSLQNSMVRYDNKDTCGKAFAATKVFVMENSDMRIQTSDETIVSTYGPIDYGRVGITASRRPDQANGCTITISIRCKGDELTMFGAPTTFRQCKTARSTINNKFRPYIEQTTGINSK
jgi:hypothetical protein